MTMPRTTIVTSGSVRSAALAALLASWACGAPTGGGDSGGPLDSGTQRDSGGGVDTGGVDTGSGMDSGGADDTGTTAPTPETPGWTPAATTRG